MEIKKNKQADLEENRMMRFLMGLIIVLSVLFVAFEYNDNNLSSDDDSSDDLSKDIELMPVTTQKNMIALVTKKQASTSEKIKIVDDNVELVQPDALNKNKEGQGSSDEGASSTDSLSNTDDQTSALSPIATDLKDNPLNFHVVEDLPQFPGGAVELMKWLTKNLRYPAEAQRQKKEGKVLVQFIINTDGAISDLSVAKSLDPLLDREAMRVMKMMPHWKPGVQRDKPCRTKVCIPIVFKL